MLYNIVSLLTLLMIFLGHKILHKIKNGEKILKIISCVLFAYKTIFYIRLNLMGEYIIPVEISALSYFIIPIIVTFGIKKYYHIASFLGIITGTGFFVFYILFGFTVENAIPLSIFLLGIICHSYLLISGLFLFKKYDFKSTNKLFLWITILAMINWAFVFFDIQTKGITFINYIISPTFLYLTSSTTLNYLLRTTSLWQCSII